MAATAYLFRWLGYYTLTRARSSIRESRITKFMWTFQISFIVLTMLSIIFVALQARFRHTVAPTLFEAYLIVLYTVVAIFILVVVSLFLRKLKENN